MFFGVRVFDAARFFFQTGNLWFCWQAQHFGGFSEFMKNTFFSQKRCQKNALQTDHWKTFWKMSSEDYF